MRLSRVAGHATQVDAQIADRRRVLRLEQKELQEEEVVQDYVSPPFLPSTRRGVHMSCHYDGVGMAFLALVLFAAHAHHALTVCCG